MKRLWCLIVFNALFLLTANTNSYGAVDGTMGTPLGGIGSGGVRFSAYNGSFYGTESAPCAMDNFRLLNNAGFIFYTSRDGIQKTSNRLKSYLKGGHLDDDAIYPMHMVNFSGINNVTVKMRAFAPVCFDSINLMCLPYAFFEVVLTNTAQTEVVVAAGLQMSSSGIPVLEPGKGFRSSGGIEHAIYASSGVPGAIVSAGSDSGFFTTGQFNNTLNDTLAAVAVKLTLAANATESVRFVYSWYNATDTNRYFYTNLVKNAGEAADIGLSHFTRLRDNASAIVTRMRASNFPEWIKDHTLNSLCNLTSNSIYTRDGRHCFTEGMFSVNGTMDQMWHARQIMTMVVPDLVWKELEWWARTQKTNPAGQIHHDMGNPMQELWGWDDKQHAEYEFQPDCNAWVDLNCAFIISVYEAFCATADRSKLDYFWPYVKKAGRAILNQVKMFGDPVLKYAFVNSLNSYDQAGVDANAFNTSLSTTAYKIMTILCEMYQDTVLRTTYVNAFDTVKISFKTKYLSNNFSAGRFTESFMAGQWIGMYLKLGQYYNQADIDYSLTTMDQYYDPLTNGLGFPSGSYHEWGPYLVAHYGGLCLQTGRFDQWRALQYDWYERIYHNRDRIFNQELGVPSKVTTPKLIADDPSVFNHYISIPVLWRNYYTMLGYFRNKSTGELWLEPVIPPEMDHSIKDGFFMSPEGYGTISASEGGEGFCNQRITFKPDRSIQVTDIYLRDKSSDSVRVYINGIEKSANRVGDGYVRKLKVNYSGSIDSTGIIVDVEYGSSGVRPARFSMLMGTQKSIQFKNLTKYCVLPHAWTGKNVIVSLYDVQGKLIARKPVKKAVIDLEKEFKLSKEVIIVKASLFN